MGKKIWPGMLCGSMLCTRHTIFFDIDHWMKILDVLAQYAVEGTLGHPFAMNCLDGAFRTGTASELDTSSFDHLDISD